MEAATAELLRRMALGERQALARAITLVESSSARHQAQAEHLLAGIIRARKRSPGVRNQEVVTGQNLKLCPPLRLGIAGPPGAGKSTLIEALGRQLTGAGHRVAVLSVDPSSRVTRGSILGDKSRMHELSRDPRAFVRPTPSGGHLGGLARRTADAVALCEFSGYDVVVVETVGVGQSEDSVDGVADVVCLVLPPASGDELQGAKKGILEVADLVVVNKCDGGLLQAARATASDYRAALHLGRPKHKANPLGAAPVLLASAKTGAGLPEVWEAALAARAFLLQSGTLLARRAGQAEASIWDQALIQLTQVVRGDPALKALVRAHSQALAEVPGGALLGGQAGGCPRGGPNAGPDARAGPVGEQEGGGGGPPMEATPRSAAAHLARAIARRLAELLPGDELRP